MQRKMPGPDMQESDMSGPGGTGRQRPQRRRRQIYGLEKP